MAPNETNLCFFSTFWLPNLTTLCSHLHYVTVMYPRADSVLSVLRLPSYLTPLQSCSHSLIYMLQESEMPSRKDTRREQSVCELSVRLRTRSRSAVENGIALTSITGDATACDQQFTRFALTFDTS